jgi:hypothetical protein
MTQDHLSRFISLLSSAWRLWWELPGVDAVESVRVSVVNTDQLLPILRERGAAEGCVMCFLHRQRPEVGRPEMGCDMKGGCE